MKRRLLLNFSGWAIASLMLAGLAACSDFSFYWQAGWGQMEILHNRRLISEVLNDESIPTTTKQKLRVILDAQRFAARELALPAEGHYRYYTDLGRPYVSWLVVAAQPLSMTEYKFCYPVVGCLGYRGYFEKEDADSLAGELRGQGLDVLVRPVRAYSTLGWFDDPVLNTFLNDDDLVLAGTIFHEQSHRLIFLEGDTAFNESFANFVEEEGVRRYLARTPRDSTARDSTVRDRTASMRRYAGKLAERRRFRAIVLRGRRRLTALYEDKISDAEKRDRKARLFDIMREDYRKERQSFKILNYDRWFSQPLNNAHMVGFSHYALYVEAFRALFQANGSDFKRFYKAVKELASLPPEKRDARLKALEKKIARLPKRPN